MAIVSRFYLGESNDPLIKLWPETYTFDDARQEVRLFLQGDELMGNSPAHEIELWKDDEETVQAIPRWSVRFVETAVEGPSA